MRIPCILSKVVNRVLFQVTSIQTFTINEIILLQESNQNLLASDLHPNLIFFYPNYIIVLLQRWLTLYYVYLKINALPGTVVGNSVSGALIAATHDWAIVFYVFGILGIIWVILFMMLCYASPESHPFISEKEKMFLGEQIGKLKHHLFFKKKHTKH